MSGGAATVLHAVRRRPDRVAIAVLVVTAFAILASYLLKVPCTGPTYDASGVSPNFGTMKYSKLCYSDVQQLWLGRGVPEHTFPYLHGRLVPAESGPGTLVDGAVEYPIITGLFMWLAGLPAHNDGQYLLYTSILLAPFGLLTAWLLAKVSGRRALLWAGAPALVIYGVYNWDFLATACVAGAFYYWYRDRPTVAALLLGVGAATKFYPGFFVLPLLLERLVDQDWKGSAKVAGAAGGAWAVINLPFLAANPDGWWATYAFQSGRDADLTTNSIWYWGFPHLSTATVDRLTVVLIALAWAAALLLGWIWRDPSGRYPWIQVSAAMLCAFLMFNKVYSPQYVLWVLPFLVLIRVRWGWWVACVTIDLCLFIGLYRWYYDITQGGDFGLGKQAAVIGVWGKTILFGLLYLVFLRSPLATGAGSVGDAALSRLYPSLPESGYVRSGAPSSTPPAGSSGPSASLDPAATPIPAGSSDRSAGSSDHSAESADRADSAASAASAASTSSTGTSGERTMSSDGEKMSRTTNMQ